MAAVKQALQAMVAEKRAISAEEAQAAMHDLFTGSSTQAQTGAFLTSLQRQVLDPEVLKACAEAMLSFASPCKVKSKQDLMDIVGTGGDGLDSFNVSTAAGIVLAASGIKCAKHGNRSASGSVGSADFLEALGCNIKLDGDQVAEAIDECGFGFLFAQMFHPAMEHVAAARKEVGGWTIFNLLGPLTNPAEPELQVIGVGKKELGMLFAEMFKAKGAKKAIIVHSSEGLDEISPSSTTFAWILDRGEITEKELSPADFGLEAHALELVTGGSAGDRATIFREILHSGKKREHDNALVRKALRNSASHLAIKDYIIINAAPAIFLAGKAKDLKSAADIVELTWMRISEARKVIDNGEALNVLDKYIAITNTVKGSQGEEQSKEGGGGGGGGGSNGPLTSLSAFRFDRLLYTSAAAKSVVVLGCFEGKEGAAILSIEKKAFDPEAVGALLGPRAILKLDFQNAEYGVYSMEVPADSNTIKCDVIFPATAKHIAKYQAPDYRLLVETPEMYQAITKPYIEREELGDRIQWVYNVLDKKKESERILLEDDDNTTGFMLLPDMKWDQITTANLHCLAIVHARTLPSLRALTADHLPLLENVLQKGCDEITRRFGVPPSKLRVYLHYQPTFYHLHVHFTHLDFVTTAGIEIGRAHLLRDVIDNIKLQPTYYQERSLEMLTTSSLGLCKEFTKAGYISTN